MIVCPHDKSQLISDKNGLRCSKCNFFAQVEDDYIFFHPEIGEDFQDYDKRGLDNLYKAENYHFWFKNRKKIIGDFFEKYIKKDEEILEIGAGTGNVARFLMEKGFKISVGEIHKNGLEYGKSYGIKSGYQFDLLESPFKEHFNVIALFDVLEHMEDDELALKNIYDSLKPDGKIILTVPAHFWLWSREDKVAAHKRRYSLKSIKTRVKNSGFEIIRAKNFFTSIIPLLLLRRIINGDDGSELKKDEILNYEIKINPMVNYIIDKLLKIEYALIKDFNLSIGGSIILIGRKK